MERAFEIDERICLYCGGPRTRIALLADGLVVRMVLSHLGLPTKAPALAPSQASPELELAG